MSLAAAGPVNCRRFSAVEEKAASAGNRFYFSSMRKNMRMLCRSTFMFRLLFEKE